MMKTLLSKMEEAESNTPSQKADAIKQELKEFYLTLVPVDKDSFAKEIRKILDGYDDDEPIDGDLYEIDEMDEDDSCDGFNPPIKNKIDAREEILSSIPEKKIDFTDIKNLMQERAKSYEKVESSPNIDYLLSTLKFEATTKESSTISTIVKILEEQYKMIKKLGDKS